MLAVLCIVSFVVRLKVFEQNNARSILIAEQSNRIIGLLLEVAKTYDIAVGLHRVEYAVGSAVCLYQSVLFKVLIYEQRVERCGIKSSQEHIDHYQQIHLSVLHTQRQVFVVVLKLIA